MSRKSNPTHQREKDLHPRNRHGDRYDFAALLRSCPGLAGFVRSNPAGEDTIDFADPMAVKALNRALLIHHYGVALWDIPTGYLCPAIPGRAECLHHLADLLAEDDEGEVPRGRKVKVLEIGVGANCVFPIIGSAEYGWKFVGADIDPVSVKWVKELAAANPRLKNNVESRLQKNPANFFKGIVRPKERFALTICNPPFHESREAAQEGTLRKLRNLEGKRPAEATLNFGGSDTELWCEGGEAGFLDGMIRESAKLPEAAAWFSTMVSKRENLPGIQRTLRKVKAQESRIIEISLGQKRSRIVAWSFQTSEDRRAHWA
jgi:23S rRNA (adenine1618-N6)-methyltransferase